MEAVRTPEIIETRASVTLRNGDEREAFELLVLSQQQGMLFLEARKYHQTVFQLAYDLRRSCYLSADRPLPQPLVGATIPEIDSILGHRLDLKTLHRLFHYGTLSEKHKGVILLEALRKKEFERGSFPALFRLRPGASGNANATAKGRLVVLRIELRRTYSHRHDAALFQIAGCEAGVQQ